MGLKFTRVLFYVVALIIPCLGAVQATAEPNSGGDSGGVNPDGKAMSLAEFVALIEAEDSDGRKSPETSPPIEAEQVSRETTDGPGGERDDGAVTDNAASVSRDEESAGANSSMSLSEFVDQFSDDDVQPASGQSTSSPNNTTKPAVGDEKPSALKEVGLTIPLPEKETTENPLVHSGKTLSYTGDLLKSTKNSETVLSPGADETDKPQPRVLWSNDSSFARDNRADEPLDIFKAVHKAIAFHPDIAESVGKLYVQKEAVNETRANYFPQVSSGLSSGYRTSTERTDEAFNVSVSQLLYDFGKVSSAVDAAEYGVVRDRAEVLITVDDLARDTARAFIEVQRYQVLVDIAERFVTAVGDLQELAAKRSAKGASSRSDEIQARSRKSSAQATVMQYRSRLDVWMTTLKNLIGVDSDVLVQGEFPAQLNTSCSRATEDFDNVPRLVLAEAERAIAKANIKNAKAEILPTLSLNAGYDHFLNQADNNAFDDDEYFTFTLDLKTKIYEGGAISARRQSAEYALNRADAARRSVLLDVERSLRESKAQSAVLSRRMSYLGERYDDIIKTQELYRQQYLSLGTRTLLDILNTEAEIFQSLFDIKNNFYELQRLQIDCLHSVAEIRDAFAVDPSLLQGMSIEL